MCARKDFDIGVGLSVGSGSMCYSEPMPDPVPDLEDLRQQLDVVDHELVELIARRLGIVASVAASKAGTGTPVRDVQRERAVLASAALTALGSSRVPSQREARLFQSGVPPGPPPTDSPQAPTHGS